MTAHSLRTAWKTSLIAALASLFLAVGARDVRAGEEDDLQRQIDTQKAGVPDLERLDELRATGDEITLLKGWLEEAWNLRAKHEYDQVREVLDRCLGQAELIRQKIAVSKLRAQVARREAELRDVHTKIDQSRKALQQTSQKRRALEAGAK